MGKVELRACPGSAEAHASSNWPLQYVAGCARSACQLSGSQESSLDVIFRRMFIPSTRHGPMTSSESNPNGISGVFPLITLVRNRMRDNVNEPVRNPCTAAGGMTLSLLILVQRMQRRLIFSS